VAGYIKLGFLTINQQQRLELNWGIIDLYAVIHHDRQETIKNMLVCMVLTHSGPRKKGIE
jgi:hypothetical protein